MGLRVKPLGLRVSRSPAPQGISSARAGTGTTASQRAPRPSPPRVRPACVRNARCNYKWPVATDGGRRCDDGACVPRGGAARPLPPTTGLFRTATPALPLAHARSHIKARTLMQTRADVRHTQRRAQSRTHSLTCPRAHSDTQTDTQTRKHADTHPHGTSHAETRFMPLETHIDKCHCVCKRTHFRSRTLPWRCDGAHSNGAQTGQAALAGTHRLAMPEHAASGPPPKASAVGDDCAHSVKRLSRMATWTARPGGRVCSRRLNRAAGLWSHA